MQNVQLRATGEAVLINNVVCLAAERLGRRRKLLTKAGGAAGVLKLHGAQERAAADPLLVAIRAYNAERKRFNAADTEQDADADADAAHMHRLFHRLAYDTPECLSEAGAEAARRLIAEHVQEHISDLPAALERAVQIFRGSRKSCGRSGLKMRKSIDERN